MKTLTALAALCVAVASPALAQLQPEELKNESLAEVMQPHWVWLNGLCCITLECLKPMIT